VSSCRCDPRARKWRMMSMGAQNPRGLRRKWGITEESQISPWTIAVRGRKCKKREEGTNKEMIGTKVVDMMMVGVVVEVEEVCHSEGGEAGGLPEV